MTELALGQFAFLNPWILAGLVALPVLWFLLRVFPPAPRLFYLPTAWLLDGLVPDEQVTSKTPWWLLLLRTLLAALILIALAQPVINPAESLNVRGALRFVIEDSWAAAQTWPLQMKAADTLLDRAARDKKEIYILTTAPDAGQTEPVQQGPMTASQARTILHGLKPKPWPATYGPAIQAVEKNRTQQGLHSYWIGTGLGDAKAVDLASALQQQGGLTYMEPDAVQRPVLLLPRLRAGQDLAVAVTSAQGFTEGMPVTAEAISTDGRILDQQTKALQSSSMPAEITFALPETLRSQVGQVRLVGRNGAGGVVLLDDLYNRRMVGLVAAHDEGKSAPLTDAGYYLRRALEPYADIQAGTVEELIRKEGLSVLILPDIGALPAETLDSLEKWVRKGGMLLRFAGPNMSQADNFLTPVPLRKGERALAGSLAWEKPQKIVPFPQSSPYYGLEIEPDIDIKQQLLSEPVADMEHKIWAELEDGTPLVTAAPLDRGMIVLIHTTATPQWSNLALSGLYVQILQRTISLAGMSDISAVTSGALNPLMVLDGMGALQNPDGSVLPIDAQKFDAQMPDSSHPPGVYGYGGMRKAFNMGSRIKSINVMPSLPTGVERTGLGGSSEVSLMPWILAAAMALFLIDWIIMLVLQGLGTGKLRMMLRPAVIVLVFGLSLHVPAMAQDTAPEPQKTVTQDMIRYASAIHLAYVQTNIPDIDQATRLGLENLSKVLKDRTSVEPAGVVAVDPAKDELSFFPLIYWPVTGQQSSMTQGALANVQFYLDHGGTILFDTRDFGISGNAPNALPTQNGLTLRTLTNGLDIPPLVQAPNDHVLSKTFYLLRSYPGRYDNGRLWVEQQSASGRDGVSSVIVGGNDWASAWAGINPPDGSEQQEMALRFGVNLMMYALTGNYKADQVHVPYILERLGQ